MSSQERAGEGGSSSRTSLQRQQQSGSVASERHTGNLPHSQTAHVHSQAAAPSQTNTSLVRDASPRRTGNPPERVLGHVQGPSNATGQTNTSSVRNGAPLCSSGNSSQRLRDHVPIQSNAINQTNSTIGKGALLSGSKHPSLILHDHVRDRSVVSGQNSTFDPKSLIQGAALSGSTSHPSPKMCDHDPKNSVSFMRNIPTVASSKGASLGGTSTHVRLIPQDHVPNKAGPITGTNSGEPKRSSDSLSLPTGQRASGGKTTDGKPSK